MRHAVRGDAHRSGARLRSGESFGASRQAPTPRRCGSPRRTRSRLAAWSVHRELAEAWATLGFVLERTGQRDDALAALGRAVVLEPDNWRHQVRLSMGTWGETRLRSARRALAQCPHLPLAHWLAASVYVARDALDQAERDVDGGLAMAAVESNEAAPFSVVAFHWLKGLLCLARGAADEALAAFDRELALEARGHLYAREVSANTWYAKGACHLGRGDRDAARVAFGEAVARVPRHPMAHAGLAILEAGTRLRSGEPSGASARQAPGSVDLAFAHAARLVATGDVPAAAGVVAAALGAAPPGNGGWLLPIEPLLGVRQAGNAWAPALAALHLRAR